MLNSFYFCILLTLLCAFSTANNYLSDKPAGLSSCKLSDPNSIKCLVRNFQTLFIEWKDGIPGLAIGTLDPFLVKRVKIDQSRDSGPVSMKLDLQNLVMHGLSKATVQDAKLDTKSWIVNAKLFIPKTQCTTDFKVDGRVLVLPLKGEGKSNFEIEKVTVFLEAKLKLKHQNDLTFADVERVSLKVKDIGGFRMQVRDLFHGQKELEAAANDLFNNNWRDLFEALRESIEEAMALVFGDRIQKIFSYVTGNYIIEDIAEYF